MTVHIAIHYENWSLIKNRNGSTVEFGCVRMRGTENKSYIIPNYIRIRLITGP